MISDAGQIRDALEGTLLHGRELEVRGNNVLVQELSGVDLRQAWQAARDQVGVTVRWPVAMLTEDLQFLGDPSPSELAAFERTVRSTQPFERDAAPARRAPADRPATGL